MLDINDICYLYKTARSKDEEIFILAQLTCSDVETIIEVLKDAELYEDNQIQKCIKCGQYYIETRRAHICLSCKKKASYERRKKARNEVR